MNGPTGPKRPKAGPSGSPTQKKQAAAKIHGAIGRGTPLAPTSRVHKEAKTGAKPTQRRGMGDTGLQRVPPRQRMRQKRS